MEMVCFQSKSAQINYLQRNEDSWGSPQSGRQAGSSLTRPPWFASRGVRSRTAPSREGLRLSPRTGFWVPWGLNGWRRKVRGRLGKGTSARSPWGPSERSPRRWGAPSEAPVRVQVAAWDLAMVGFAFVPVLLGRPAWGAWLGSSWRGWPQRAEGGRERVCFADLHFLGGGIS